MGVHRRWALLCCLTLNLVLPVFCLAAVSGQCSNCHTMHNLQDGSPVAYTMDPDGEINLREQPFGNLLKTDCLGCHTSAGAETIVDLGGCRRAHRFQPARPDLSARRFRHIDSCRG